MSENHSEADRRTLILLLNGSSLSSCSHDGFHTYIFFQTAHPVSQGDTDVSPKCCTWKWTEVQRGQEMRIQRAAVSCMHWNIKITEGAGVFTHPPALFTALHSFLYLISIPSPRFPMIYQPIFPRIFSSHSSQFRRNCLRTKWFTPLEWMPEVTSCPTSCLTMLAVCSAGKLQRGRRRRTWIGSSTSCGTTTAAYALTSLSIRICWHRASWRRGGTVAWTGPGSSLSPDPPSATS